MNSLCPPTLAGFCPPHRLAGVTQGDVLLALSGGADSVALLSLLLHDARARGYRLAAAHVHHGIRPASECEHDLAHCAALCERLGIPFYAHRADVPALARERGLGLEECARQVRYEYFDALMRREGFSLLATAHHADDNLETVLLHLSRGASLDGLVGIAPARPFGCGSLVRPLLTVPKERILSFCRENALAYVTDSTNTDTDYARNLLRARVLPVLQQINPAVTDATARLCADLREDARYLKDRAEALLAAHRSGDALDVRALREAPRPIAARALCLHFLSCSGGISLAHTHVEALLSLCREGRSGTSYDLPAHLCAVLEGSALRITRRTSAFPDLPPYEVTLHEGINVISQTGCEIFMGNSQNGINVYKTEIRMSFASDTIKGDLVARSRRAGDKILAGGMHKDVRRLMSDRHLPHALRATLPILCDDEGILAIPTLATRDGSAAASTDSHALIVCLSLPHDSI